MASQILSRDAWFRVPRGGYIALACPETQPEAKGLVLDRGDRHNADVQCVAIQRVGGNDQSRPLLVEHKQANIASLRKPPRRDAGSLQGHQWRAKDSMVADSNARRSVRSAGEDA